MPCRELFLKQVNTLISKGLARILLAMNKMKVPDKEKRNMVPGTERSLVWKSTQEAWEMVWRGGRGTPWPAWEVTLRSLDSSEGRVERGVYVRKGFVSEEILWHQSGNERQPETRRLVRVSYSHVWRGGWGRGQWPALEDSWVITRSEQALENARRQNHEPLVINWA